MRETVKRCIPVLEAVFSEHGIPLKRHGAKNILSEFAPTAAFEEGNIDFPGIEPGAKRGWCDYCPTDYWKSGYKLRGDLGLSR